MTIIIKKTFLYVAEGFISTNLLPHGFRAALRFSQPSIRTISTVRTYRLKQQQTFMWIKTVTYLIISFVVAGTFGWLFFTVSEPKLVVSIPRRFELNLLTRKYVIQNFDSETSWFHWKFTANQTALAGRLGGLPNGDVDFGASCSNSTKEVCVLWQNGQKMTVTKMHDGKTSCYEFQWIRKEPQGAFPMDCVSLFKNWIKIGMPDVYVPMHIGTATKSYNAHGQFQYWISSDGYAVYTPSQEGISVNISGAKKDHICFKSTNYELRYHICQGNNPKTVHNYILSKFIKPNRAKLSAGSCLRGVVWQITNSEMENSMEILQNSGIFPSLIIVDGTHWDDFMTANTLQEHVIQENMNTATKTMLAYPIYPFISVDNFLFKTAVSKKFLVQKGNTSVIFKQGYQLGGLLDYKDASCKVWLKKTLLKFVNWIRVNWIVIRGSPAFSYFTDLERLEYINQYIAAVKDIHTKVIIDISDYTELTDYTVHRYDPENTEDLLAAVSAYSLLQQPLVIFLPAVVDCSQIINNAKTMAWFPVMTVSTGECELTAPILNSLKPYINHYNLTHSFDTTSRNESAVYIVPL